MTYRHERRCRTGTALMAGGMALAASAFGHAQPGYEFDDRLLLGSSLGGGDLSRFNQDGRIDPGRYHVDVYLNERFASRSEVSFAPTPPAARWSPASKTSCASASAPSLAKSRARATKVPTAPFSTRACPARGSAWTSPACAWTSRCRKPCSTSSRAATSAPRWDAGDSMGFVKRHQPLSLRLPRRRIGTIGLRLCRPEQRHQPRPVAFAPPVQLHLFPLQRAGQAQVERHPHLCPARLAGLAQRTDGGESYTAGNLLGSIGYRGLSLATDDRMLPESLRRYAPQVAPRPPRRGW